MATTGVAVNRREVSSRVGGDKRQRRQGRRLQFGEDMQRQIAASKAAGDRSSGVAATGTMAAVGESCRGS